MFSFCTSSFCFQEKADFLLYDSIQEATALFGSSHSKEKETKIVGILISDVINERKIDEKIDVLRKYLKTYFNEFALVILGLCEKESSFCHEERLSTDGMKFVMETEPAVRIAALSRCNVNILMDVQSADAWWAAYMSDEFVFYSDRNLENENYILPHWVRLPVI